MADWLIICVVVPPWLILLLLAVRHVWCGSIPAPGPALAPAPALNPTPALAPIPAFGLAPAALTARRWREQQRRRIAQEDWSGSTHLLRERPRAHARPAPSDIEPHVLRFLQEQGIELQEQKQARHAKWVRAHLLRNSAIRDAFGCPLLDDDEGGEADPLFDVDVADTEEQRIESFARLSDPRHPHWMMPTITTTRPPIAQIAYEEALRLQTEADAVAIEKLTRAAEGSAVRRHLDLDLDRGGHVHTMQSEAMVAKVTRLPDRAMEGHRNDWFSGVVHLDEADHPDGAHWMLQGTTIPTELELCPALIGVKTREYATARKAADEEQVERDRRALLDPATFQDPWLKPSTDRPMSASEVMTAMTQMMRARAQQDEAAVPLFEKAQRDATEHRATIRRQRKAKRTRAGAGAGAGAGTGTGTDSASASASAPIVASDDAFTPLDDEESEPVCSMATLRRRHAKT